MVTNRITSGKARKATAGTDGPIGRRIGAFDAFERLQLEVIALEALANAANTAMDEYRIPASAPLRELRRVHALVSDTAVKAEALVRLAEDLKTAVVGHPEGSPGDQAVPDPADRRDAPVNGRESPGSSAPRARRHSRAAGRVRARRAVRPPGAATATSRSSRSG